MAYCTISILSTHLEYELPKERSGIMSGAKLRLLSVELSDRYLNCLDLLVDV